MYAAGGGGVVYGMGEVPPVLVAPQFLRAAARLLGAHVPWCG